MTKEDHLRFAMLYKMGVQLQYKSHGEYWSDLEPPKGNKYRSALIKFATKDLLYEYRIKPRD